MFKIKLDQNDLFWAASMTSKMIKQKDEFIINLENFFRLIFGEICEKVELFCLIWGIYARSAKKMATPRKSFFY